MNLAEAKQRLTIHDLWRHFGFEGEPSKSCRCPFHEDRSNSFSVTDGTVFNCFAGCGRGDAVSFYALASGLPHKEACRAFIAIAGGASLPATPRPPKPKPENEEREKAARREQWPFFESPVPGEDGAPRHAMPLLAKLRHVSLEGVQLMASRGLLYFTTWKGLPSWVVTDDARKNAQVRRMDGGRWGSPEGPKAWTLPGSEALRPIGARESQQFPVVLFVEGSGDLPAAHHFIHAQGHHADAAAVAMLGAGMNIHPASLPVFGGKRVWIFPHTDKPGRAAAARWAEQLATVEATVDAVDFTGLVMADGSPIEDLNDCTRIDPKLAHEISNLIPT